MFVSKLSKQGLDVDEVINSRIVINAITFKYNRIALGIDNSNVNKGFGNVQVYLGS